jgi:DDE family transposase
MEPTIELEPMTCRLRKVEALFAELKNQIGLRRLRLPRLKFVRERFFLAASAQNVKRLVRFLSQVPRPDTATI